MMQGCFYLIEHGLNGCNGFTRIISLRSIWSGEILSPEKEQLSIESIVSLRSLG